MPEPLVERVLALATPGSRIVIGITGSPGAGKTTLAKRVVAGINSGSDVTRAVYLPMDGFHLANATLDRLGLRERKGAIETFDGWGFVALLQRVLAERDHPVYAPSFERAVDEGIAGEVVIPPEADIVIVEGNYLLVDRQPWNRVPGLLAESWFCETGADERLARLVARHTEYGRSFDAALAWASSVDGANALLVEATKPRADLLVSGTA
ncbi:nucleoside/nucleotide kinase family protein [Conyzicola nivalis]|uniref:Nucleoside/nucleotide kinase family protein n=1 Tax=Conyzicola nivalis TaxID=1477021 RepID=A0A916WLY7_9MICO|nr:nucleoside/nucleotide kinase family protein [Conyzicola nivalis]GGB12836.1 nucleoside/nucleotide kinase family protein [Conyzicola nivalis]